MQFLTFIVILLCFFVIVEKCNFYKRWREIKLEGYNFNVNKILYFEQVIDSLDLTNFLFFSGSHHQKQR